MGINYIPGMTGHYKEQAEAVIAVGMSLIGKVTYDFGGPGIEAGRADCSQFTQYCFKKGANLEIGRTTGNQITKGTRLGLTMDSPATGGAISAGKMERGDLVFFKNTYQSSHPRGVSHVGIYLGNDEMLNLSGSRNVNVAKIMGNTYWKPRFLEARRVLTAENSMIGGGSGRVMSMVATAYGGSALNVMGGPGFVADWITASGREAKQGRTIAADITTLPMGTIVQLTCPEWPAVNGTYTVEDVGGAIKGNKIDIYFDDKYRDKYAAQKEMLDFGERNVQIKIIGKDPDL